MARRAAVCEQRLLRVVPYTEAAPRRGSGRWCEGELGSVRKVRRDTRVRGAGVTVPECGEFRRVGREQELGGGRVRGQGWRLQAWDA